MAVQWLSLVAIIWLQSINGTNSNFPSYSSELKRILSISQLQLNNIASANDAGKLLGWISGIAAAYLPLWLVLLIGAFLGLVGYGVQFLFLTNQISASLSYWQIFLLTVLAGNSICWINTVCYIIAIKNFPLDRQIAVGLSTSYVGLSAKIYTDIVDVVVGDPSRSNPAARAKGFLLLNSVVPLMACVVAAPLARDVNNNVGKSKKLAGGFLAMFMITIATGIFAVVTSFGSVNLSGLVLPKYVILVGMFVFLVLPMAIPVAERVGEKLQQKCLIRVHDEGYFTAAKSSTNNFAAMENGGREIKNDEESEISRRREVGVISEIGAKEMVGKVEFWLYFFVYSFGATLGLVYLNNLGQISESRGCSGTSSLVSLSSAFGFFGRLLPSLLDYFFARSKWLVSSTGGGAMGAMMVPMCGAFFLLLNQHLICLYISTAIIGICTGAITSISVSTTTELFGTKNFGINHNIVVSNIPIGSFLFGDFAALLYKRSGTNNNIEDCMGQKCYQTTFISWGCLCVLGTLLALTLHSRTKKLYSHNRIT